MEFWGQEVKPGATVSCKVDDGFIIHLSQTALGESKKQSEDVVVTVKIDDQKLVLGTLSLEKHPQILSDLVFDKDFVLSHNSKTASVFFCGYKTLVPVDEEPETDQIPMQNNEIKNSAAKVPVKVESSSSEDDDFSDSDSDIEMSDEDDSSDEDEVSSGDDSSDDSDSEEQTPTPTKTDVVGKKRAIEAEAPFGKKAKSEQSAQKTGDKKVLTPHTAKQFTKTPADKSTKTPKSGSHACKSCNKSFGSASALESHQKAKKHEA